MSKNVLITGVDVLDTISFLATKNKRFQATVLNQLEEIMGDDREKFFQIRKIYLDSSNNFLRSVLRTIFGDIENAFK